MMPLKAIGSSLLPFVGKELSTTFSFDLSATMPRHLSESEQNKFLTMLKHKKIPSEMLPLCATAARGLAKAGLRKVLSMHSVRAVLMLSVLPRLVAVLRR